MLKHIPRKWASLPIDPVYKNLKGWETDIFLVVKIFFWLHTKMGIKNILENGTIWCVLVYILNL